mgnify:CR=1 FL=1
MYTFSSKLKTFSLVLMVIGILGLGYGFLTAPKNIEEVEKILAAEAHGHHESAAVPAHAEAHNAEVVEAAPAHDSIQTVHDSTAVDTASVAVTPVAESHHESAAAPAHEDAHAAHQEHLTHVLHQLQNKPWSALYVACIFFMLISLGVLVFFYQVFLLFYFSFFLLWEGGTMPSMGAYPAFRLFTKPILKGVKGPLGYLLWRYPLAPCGGRGSVGPPGPPKEGREGRLEAGGSVGPCPPAKGRGVPPAPYPPIP